MDGYLVSYSSSELMKRFRQHQKWIITELAIKPLPRQRDRITRLTWNEMPMSYTQSRFGAQETSSTESARRGWQVDLSPELQDVSFSVLDWVIWREALLGFLLPHLRQIPETADLGLFAGLAFGGFTTTQEEELMVLWRQVSPPQHHQYYVYDAPFGFPLYDRVVDGTFLQRVVPWLNTLRPTASRTSLASKTYTGALERWMLETHIPLTRPEHRILKALTQITTSLHQSRLAKQLDMTVSGLSQHLTKLAQRHLLRLNHFINLPLIGLIPQELFLSTPNPRIRQHLGAIFRQIRYTWLINPIKQTSLHCRVFIPEDRVTKFHSWLNELTAKYDLLPVSPIRTSEVFQSWNFDIYYPEQGWLQDFTLLLHQVYSELENQLDTDFSLITTSTFSYEQLNDNQNFPIQLRSEDFIYFLRAADIHQITDRITAQPSKELRQAGISPSAHMVYRRRVKQLEKLNISHVKGMFLMHIGLDTVLQIYLYEPREITKQIILALSRFPNLNGLILENGHGIIFLYIPNHSAIETLSTLRKTFGRLEMNVTIEVKPTWQSISGLEFPVKSKNYDFNKGKWKWDQNTLPQLGIP